MISSAALHRIRRHGTYSRPACESSCGCTVGSTVTAAASSLQIYHCSSPEDAYVKTTRLPFSYRGEFVSARWSCSVHQLAREAHVVSSDTCFPPGYDVGLTAPVSLCGRGGTVDVPKRDFCSDRSEE